MGNCDTMLYLGGNEQSTHEYISKMLGKETIDTRTRGITRGSHGSSNTNYQNTGRELLTLDEVRLLDNSNALIFIRGEKPIVDKKYDILSHPNIKLTADGGAVPYTHNKQGKYFRENLSFEVDENVDVSEIVVDVKEGDFVSNKRNEVMNTQTNGDGIAVFYTVLEALTDKEGKAVVSKYEVTVTNIIKEAEGIKDLLVKYIPEVLDKDKKIVTPREIRVIANENIEIPKGGKIQIAVFDNEAGQYVQNIKIRFITETKKPDVIPKEEQKAEPEEEKTQPQEKQTKNNLLETIKKIKSKLWRN